MESWPIGVEFAQVGLDTPDGQIHLRQLPGGGVGILAKYGDFIEIPAVALHKFGRLDKHTAAAAAGVVDPAVVGLQDLHQRSYHAGGRIEFSGLLALLGCKLGQTVFVGAPQNVLAAPLLDHLDIGKEVYHLAQPPLVQLRAGKVLGQNAAEPGVALFDAPHGLVDHQADLRGMCRRGNDAPPGIFRHEEDILGGILVLVLLEALALFHQRLVLRLEPVRNIFQENQPQHHGLIFRGVHIPPQHTGRVPDLLLKADFRCIALCHVRFLRLVSLSRL